MVGRTLKSNYYCYCRALTCLVLSCSALTGLVCPGLILFCPVLPCLVWCGLVLSCSAFSCLALPCQPCLVLSCLALPCPVLPHLWGDNRCLTPPPCPSLHYHQTKLNPVSIAVSSLSLDGFLSERVQPVTNTYASPSPLTPTPLHNPDMSVTFTRSSQMTDAPFHTQTSIHSEIVSSLCYNSFTTSSMSTAHIFNSLSHQTPLMCQWWLMHTLVKVVKCIFCDGQAPYLATTSGQEHQPMLPRFEWQALVSQSACSDKTQHYSDWLPVLLDISKSFPCGKVLCTKGARLQKGRKRLLEIIQTCGYHHSFVRLYVSGPSFLSL